MLNRFTFTGEKLLYISNIVSKKQYYKLNFLDNGNLYFEYQDDVTDVYNPINLYLVKNKVNYKLYIVRDKAIHEEKTVSNSQVVFSSY